MKIPRKHAELIRQWADDDSLKIQGRRLGDIKWQDITILTWDDSCEFRIKPEVIRYRVAFIENKQTVTVDNYEQEIRIKNSPNFTEWLTDWIEVEI